MVFVTASNTIRYFDSSVLFVTSPDPTEVNFVTFNENITGTIRITYIMSQDSFFDTANAIVKLLPAGTILAIDSTTSMVGITFSHDVPITANIGDIIQLYGYLSADEGPSAEYHDLRVCYDYVQIVFTDPKVLQFTMS